MGRVPEACGKSLEVISIYAYLAFSALGHRGLRHFHRNTGFASLDIS
jgi:hypothetical protein